MLGKLVYDEAVPRATAYRDALAGHGLSLQSIETQAQLDQLDDIRGLIAHAHPGIKLADLIELMATEYRLRHHPEEKAKRAWARQEKKLRKRHHDDAPQHPFGEASADEKRRSALQPQSDAGKNQT